MTTTLNKPATTFYTTLWRVIARDGSSVAATTGSRDILYNSVLYQKTALNPSQQQLIENLDPSNLEVVLPLVQGGITEQQIDGGKWNAARVEIVFYDYINLTALRTWKGVLADIDRNNGRLKVEALDIGVLFNQPQGDLYQELCRADFGDSKCGKTPATSGTRTVGSAVSRAEFVISGYTLPTSDSDTAGYFDYGICTFTSGDNNGVNKEIRSAVQEGADVRVKLVESVPYAIAAAVTVVLKEGCDGQYRTCIKKDNAANNRSEPNIPGLYRILDFPK